jgi:hypothetical protein
MAVCTCCIALGVRGHGGEPCRPDAGGRRASRAALPSGARPSVPPPRGGGPGASRRRGPWAASGARGWPARCPASRNPPARAGARAGGSASGSAPKLWRGGLARIGWLRLARHQQRGGLSRDGVARSPELRPGLLVDPRMRLIRWDGSGEIDEIDQMGLTRLMRLISVGFCASTCWRAGAPPSPQWMRGRVWAHAPPSDAQSAAPWPSGGA